MEVLFFCTVVACKIHIKIKYLIENCKNKFKNSYKLQVFMEMCKKLRVWRKRFNLFQNKTCENNPKEHNFEVSF